MFALTTMPAGWAASGETKNVRIAPARVANAVVESRIDLNPFRSKPAPAARVSLFLQRPVIQLQGRWPRIAVKQPRDKPMQKADRIRIKRNVRTIWISDVHLGFAGCSAAYLLEFIRDMRCDPAALKRMEPRRPGMAA